MDLKNWKNIQCEKFEKCPIWKIRKFFRIYSKLNNFRISTILWICQSRKFLLEYNIRIEKLKRRIDLYQRANMRIGKNRKFLERNFDFPNWKISRNSLIFQFRQFQKLLIWKIRKNFNLESSENVQFGKFKKIWIPKIR